MQYIINNLLLLTNRYIERITPTYRAYYDIANFYSKLQQ